MVGKPGWGGEDDLGKQGRELGTYCLKVLMSVETSLLSCLGPHEARICSPLVPDSRQVGGGWELSGIPKFWGASPSRPFRRVLSRAGSHPRNSTQKAQKNSGMLFPDCVLTTKRALEMSYLFPQGGFCGQISLGNPSPGSLQSCSAHWGMKGYEKLCRRKELNFPVCSKFI